MTLNLAGCWGPRQNVDSRWRGHGVAMGWFSYCWFWVIWLILNRLLNQSLLPLRIGRFARLATQVCVSFHRVIDCHLMPIDWPPDWLIALSRSINRHSLLVKSGHCAAFADWSTLEEKVDFEPIFSQLVAVTCSQWIQALLKIKKMRKFTFDRVSARCKLWLLWKSDNNSSSCDTFWRWPWVSWWWWWWYFWAAGTQNFSRWGCCCCFYHCFDKKKDCGGSLPGDLLGTDRVHQALWGPHSFHNHHGGNPTATTTHPQLMLIFN